MIIKSKCFIYIKFDSSVISPYANYKMMDDPGTSLVYSNRSQKKSARALMKRRHYNPVHLEIPDQYSFMLERLKFMDTAEEAKRIEKKDRLRQKREFFKATATQEQIEAKRAATRERVRQHRLRKKEKQVKKSFINVSFPIFNLCYLNFKTK